MTTHRLFYLNLIFWVGFTSLVYEIYSIKVLFLFFTETTYAVTLALSAFLAGLASSSLLFSVIAKKHQDNRRLIWWMQIIVAAYAYLVLTHYDWIPQLVDAMAGNISHSGILAVAKGAIFWVYLFIPAFFIGGAFPLVNGLYLNTLESKTQDTGMVYFWDTLGSIAGVMCAGFWLLPELGYRFTALVAVSINLLLALLLSTQQRTRLALGAALALVLALELWPVSNPASSAQQAQARPTTPALATAKPPASAPLPTAPLAPDYPQLSDRFGQVLFQKNSPFGRITVGMNALYIPGNKGLFINYRDMCFSIEHGSETLLGFETVKALPKGARVLNIGLGCGYTASSIAAARNVSHLDVIEINPVVAEAAATLFAEENHHVLAQPKTTLHLMDGAQYIRTTRQSYHAVVIDIEEVSIIYSSPLYTREYFQQIHDKLLPGGVLAVWAQTGSPEFEKTLYNTLQAVYKNVYVHITNDLYSFYASDQPLDIRPQSQEEAMSIEQLLNTPVTEVNTLDNNALEKYFNVREFFNLPYDYRERYIQERAVESGR